MFLIKKSLKCKECIFSEYHRSDIIAGCGFICKLNPFKPVAMGLLGQHFQRKENKIEQYSKKGS